MAQINDLLVLGESNLLGTLNVFGDITAPNFYGIASHAKLLSLSHGQLSSTATTDVTSWTGGITNVKYVWGQKWIDSTLGTDSGDFALALRAGVYTANSTELCMMIDGDYYSMGQKIAHAKNSSFSAWTGGTAAGPILNLSLGGTNLAAPAVPAASNTASGIVTTGAQTFAGAKTFSAAPTLSSGFIWPAPANISASATANGQEWSIDLLGSGATTYTGTYFHVWSSKLGASILACYTDDRKVKAFVDMEVGNNLSVGGGITAGGTIKSTFDGPAFYAEVGSGKWAYQRLKSYNYIWDVGVKSSDLDGALQFRYNSADAGRMYITRTGNVSIGGTELAISVNKVKLQYVADTESLDFVFS